jgi:hypothetical protein
MTAMTDTQIRELDSRTSDGIEVRLLWNARTDRVSVSVDDRRYGDSFALDVEPAVALDAFRHPYAYAHMECRERALAA